MSLQINSLLDDRTEALIRNIIGAAIDVHRQLGPGFLEKIYEQAMAIELNRREIKFATQVPVAVDYRGVKIRGQIADIVVEEKVILELKAVESLLPVHKAQILSYMNATDLTAGLLINFKEFLVKDGIKRFVKTNRFA